MLNTDYSKPVYRKDIIETALHSCLKYGLCRALRHAFFDHGIEYSPDYIPKFTRENAMQFGATGTYAFWWPCDPGYDKERRNFLQWLLKEYENDTTDLWLYMLGVREKEGLEVSGRHKN